MYRLAITLFVIFSCTNILSKENIHSVTTNIVTGVIIDANTSKPLEFVNISMLSVQDSMYIDGTLTDSSGQFNLLSKDVEDVILKITYMNHDIKTILIKMVEGTNSIDTVACQYSHELEEVVVESDHSAIVNEGSKLIFNVQYTPFKQGYTGLDVLKVTPKVNVSSSGEVKIRNKEVKVMINGHLIPSEQVNNYIQNINSDDIKKIEVESFNSADKDGDTQGGTINIITKTTNKGIYSTIRTTFSYLKDNYYSQQSGLRIDYGGNNYNIYGSYYFGNGNDFSSATTTYKKISSKQILVSDYDTKLYPRNHSYVLGTVVNLTEKHSLGFEFSGINDIPLDIKGVGFVNLLNFDLLNIDRADSKSKIKNTTDLYNTLAFYDWQINEGSQIKILGGYFRHKIRNNNSLISNFKLDSLNNINELNITNSKTKNYFGQIDFSKNISSDLSYQLGTKYSATDRESFLTSNKFIDQSNPSVSFSSYDYKEKIYAAYTSISKNFEEKIYLTAGLRYEYTSLRGYDVNTGKVSRYDNDFFPSFTFSHHVNEKITYSANYSKNISRPSFALLSNSIVRVDEQMYDVGNPLLRPQFTHKYELDFNYGSHNLALYHENVSKAIREDWTVTDSIIYHTNINGKAIKYYGLDYSFSNSISPFLYTSIYVGFMYTKIPSSYYKKHYLSAYLSNYNVFTITDKISIDLFEEYNSGSINPNTYVKNNWSIGFAYNQSFMKDQLRLKLSVTDIFNTKKDRIEVKSPDLNYSLYQKDLTRGIILSIFYSVGKRKKDKAKSVDYLNESINRL